MVQYLVQKRLVDYGSLPKVHAWYCVRPRFGQASFFCYTEYISLSVSGCKLCLSNARDVSTVHTAWVDAPNIVEKELWNDSKMITIQRVEIPGFQRMRKWFHPEYIVDVQHTQK